MKKKKKLLSGNEGSWYKESKVLTSEREDKRSQNPVTMHSGQQGNSYFLLPSSVTLPAAPSLETLYGTRRCNTEHERRGRGERVKLKTTRCLNTQNTSRPVHRVTQREACREGGSNQEEPTLVFVLHAPQLLTWVWQARVCRSRRWSGPRRSGPSGGAGTWGRVWQWWACPSRPGCPRSSAGRTRPPAEPRTPRTSFFWENTASLQHASTTRKQQGTAGKDWEDFNSTALNPRDENCRAFCVFWDYCLGIVEGCFAGCTTDHWSRLLCFK